MSNSPTHWCKPNPHLIGVTFNYGEYKVLIEEQPADPAGVDKLFVGTSTRTVYDSRDTVEHTEDTTWACKDCMFMFNTRCPKFAHRGSNYDCKRHGIIFTKVQD